MVTGGAIGVTEIAVAEGADTADWVVAIGDASTVAGMGEGKLVETTGDDSCGSGVGCTMACAIGLAVTVGKSAVVGTAATSDGIVGLILLSIPTAASNPTRTPTLTKPYFLNIVCNLVTLTYVYFTD